MTVSEFTDNLADLNDGENFPRSLLNEIYQSIRNEPFELELLVQLFNYALCMTLNVDKQSLISNTFLFFNNLLA